MTLCTEKLGFLIIVICIVESLYMTVFSTLSLVVRFLEVSKNKAVKVVQT